MKIAVAAAAAATLAAFAVPAAAQSAFSPVSGYANLGVSRYDFEDFGQTSAQARAGARFGRYLGVEGEGVFGLGSNTDDASGVTYKQKYSFAGYGVGFLPLGENADLFARVGYGRNKVRFDIPNTPPATGTTRTSESVSSVNYGGGVQYFFSGNNGLRAEYTRYDLKDGLGGANQWAISYVRRF